MTHHITDEQIDELLYTLNDIASAYNSDEYGLPLGCSDIKEQPHDKMRAAIRAVLALAAPAPAVPTGMLLVSADLIRRAQHAINWHLEPNSPDEHEATMRELAGLLTATPTPSAQSESPCACWPGRMCSRSAQCARDFQPAAPAVPSDERAALQRIADWSEHPPMLGVDYGSNGVRDYYRKIARAALTAAPTPPAQKPATGWRLLHEDLDEANKFWDEQKYTYADAGSTVISWGPDKRLYVFDLPALAAVPTPPAPNDDAFDRFVDHMNAKLAARKAEKGES